MTEQKSPKWKIAGVALGLPLLTSGCYATAQGAYFYDDPYYSSGYNGRGGDYVYCDYYYDGYYPSGFELYYDDYGNTYYYDARGNYYYYDDGGNCYYFDAVSKYYHYHLHTGLFYHSYYTPNYFFGLHFGYYPYFPSIYFINWYPHRHKYGYPHYAYNGGFWGYHGFDHHKKKISHHGKNKWKSNHPRWADISGNKNRGYKTGNPGVYDGDRQQRRGSGFSQQENRNGAVYQNGSRTDRRADTPRPTRRQEDQDRTTRRGFDFTEQNQVPNNTQKSRDRDNNPQLQNQDSRPESNFRERPRRLQSDNGSSDTPSVKSQSNDNPKPDRASNSKSSPKSNSKSNRQDRSESKKVGGKGKKK